ncbi:MAG: PTS-dependent dihydroxyacetone kinase phosphotransferase subunit DhaM [Eubacterium sp.]|nr:PTS-dependent dihydroxyacetone kinase phosphotransferase subunit DhaM [Eubacterium sp.]MDD7210661.1 dihydroxyacetone kinase phosphoryl donor subunit DhaM [Lachnospiraceae bacterium]MDY5497710.1 dihydroxyacetone kinase phosphoryl donor subunit DhaM [Anaerobutyricum sp.]
MGKIGVILVSHSEYIAKGLKELVNEMNDGSVPVIAAGGADGGRIGTSAIKIQEAIESMEDCDHILIYADLGSSILSAETAMDLIEEELAEKVQIVDAPIVEGALSGVVQATISDDVNEVIRASEEARDVHKI